MTTHVHLVEDDEDDFLLIREALEAHGDLFALEWSRGCDEAIEQWRHRHPDVCLIDYHLGRHTGLDLIKKAIGMGLEAPLILMTGAGYDERLDERALVLGADDYLSKEEVTPPHLRRTLLFNIQRKETENRYRAGEAALRQMNEISSGTLHNIGNVLNNLGVSIQDIEATAKKVPASRLGDLAEIIEKNDALMADDKARLIPEYLNATSEAITKGLASVCAKVKENMDKLMMAVGAIEIQQKSMRVPKTETLCLADIIGEALSLYRARLVRDQIECTIDESLWIEVYFSRATLLHIMINLVKNAIEALAETADKQIRATLDKTDAWLAVRIADNGCGIDGETLARLFGHGYTTKHEGNGFGLHFCRQALTREGCAIDAHSEGKGKGSTFEIRIPTALLAGEEPRASRMEAGGSGLEAGRQESA